MYPVVFLLINFEQTHKSSRFLNHQFKTRIKTISFFLKMLILLNSLETLSVNLTMLKDIKWICQNYQQILKQLH